MRPTVLHLASRYEMSSAFDRDDTESIATSSASVCWMVMKCLECAGLTALWFGVPPLGGFEGAMIGRLKAELQTGSPPQSLLQFIIPFDNLFLDQMLALRHNGFAVHNNLL